MVASNKHFGYQMLTDLLEIWTEFFKSWKLCNLDVENYAFFSFTTNNSERNVINFNRENI